MVDDVGGYDTVALVGQCSPTDNVSAVIDAAEMLRKIGETIDNAVVGRYRIGRRHEEI